MKPGQESGRAIMLLAGGLGAILFWGCEATVPPCLIEGVVHVDGEPASGVYVMLTPKDDEKAAGASSIVLRSEEAGQYRLRAAIPGEYTINAFWPAVIVSNGETIEGEDRFRGKYRNLDHPVAKFDVFQGENQLPDLDLKSR